MESESGRESGNGGFQDGTRAGVGAWAGSGSGEGAGPGSEGDGPGDPERVVLAEDRRWVHDLWAAFFCSLSLIVLLHLVDLAAGTVEAGRSMLWAGLAATLFVVLFPPRVTAGRHWLSVRGLLGERRVSTDLLTQVSRRDGIAQRIVLKDVRGRRVEVDPTTLAANPLLWHELDRGARVAGERGLLRTGSPVLRTLRERIESDTARAVFEASDLV
ncbi:hypothetical protein [Streptomyces katsurahamanus]|uniref:hypothetical protein n=1 Tax=Streptomyces katsurahamanus TaxID=2577098 RepID=UPI001E2DE646|nr:hypothetical protein [Streptomyces katsurahamanus]